jgi:hypothetical protein
MFEELSVLFIHAFVVFFFFPVGSDSVGECHSSSSKYQYIFGTIATIIAKEESIATSKVSRFFERFFLIILTFDSLSLKRS